MGEGAERIIQRILEDARESAASIIAEAEKKAESIEAEAKQKSERKQEQILEQARKEADEQKRRIIGVAQLEARKEMLTAKQKLISDAFAAALSELGAMEEGSYFRVIQGMLLKLAETGEETVVFSSRDFARIPDGFWREINDALLKEGKKGDLKPAKEAREISGGFILQTEGAEINASFDALLEMSRDDLEPEVAEVLFG
jgi:V/A-type H+/Na+-transporting ATPase subunit E